MILQHYHWRLTMNKTETETTLPDWYIFTGDKNNKKEEFTLPDAPSWRKNKRGIDNYITISEKEKKLVNAALYLRRPLLITGKPGSGKSSLAWAVAEELGMGNVLEWRITTSSKYTDGFYTYDVLSRLNDIQLGKDDKTIVTDIKNYLKLEALGVAFASKKQRVVLIDEIDKSDIDLPNNLLHVFEENKFEIPELKRLKEYKYQPFEGSKQYREIENGIVECDVDTFPLIIMTSNGERDFPPAFMRRCLHLEMELPTHEQLATIVEAHFENAVNKKDLDTMIESFLKIREKNYLSTDQLLNAIYLIDKKGIDINSDENKEMVDSIWHSLAR